MKSITPRIGPRREGPARQQKEPILPHNHSVIWSPKDGADFVDFHFDVKCCFLRLVGLVHIDNGRRFNHDALHIRPYDVKLAVRMSHDDYDIPDLAAYLHLTPLQVTRLADRGKLPARRVGGQWRFSRAEIHHWFEERIGVCDDDHQLAEMEDVLQQGAVLAAGDCSELEGSVSIARLLDPRCIAKPLPARTRRSVIEAMIDLASSTGLLWDPEKMRQAVHAREELHPTALDNGVALLHPRRPMPSILGASFLTFGVTPQGIPFGGSRGHLTDLFFLICSSVDREHLQILARISRLTADVSFLEQIRAAVEEKEIHRLIKEAEMALGE